MQWSHIMRKWATALLLSAMVLSGCIGEDSGESENAAMWDEGLTQLSLEGLDDITLTKEFFNQIKQFEESHHNSKPFMKVV